jgi:NAD(P)-dependent dehydrogenase (short-subunit alcohol dehydrogenase family)
MQLARTALVTGGARRIGLAIVRDLAAHGWAVAIHCKGSAEEAQKIADEIRAGEGRAAVVVADLGDPLALASVVGKATEALGPIALLVNNAAVFVPDRAGSLDYGVWQTHFDVNLRAPVFLADAYAAQLPEGAEGNIVNVIDQRVWKLTPEAISYTLAKSALWTATQILAQALAPKIRVNAIGPGPTFPNATEGDEGVAREAAGVPLRRLVDPAEFGRAIRFLVESRSMTGQMLALDSGQHLGWETPDVTGGRP